MMSRGMTAKSINLNGIVLNGDAPISPRTGEFLGMHGISVSQQGGVVTVNSEGILASTYQNGQLHLSCLSATKFIDLGASKPFGDGTAESLVVDTRAFLADKGAYLAKKNVLK